MNSKYIVISSVFSLIIMSQMSCGSSGGSSIGAPEIEPPVTRNSPSGFLTTSQQNNSINPVLDNDDLERLRTQIFGTGDGVGPAAFRNNLDSVDERMTSLDSRAQESERACLSEDASQFSFPEAFALPGDLEFPLYFQCFEQLSADLQLAFGIRDERFYLMEIQQDGDEARMILANAALDGSEVETWWLSVSPTNAGAMHIQAADENSALTMNYAATDANNGTTCGVFVRSNDDLVYVNSAFEDTSTPGDCSAKTSSCLNPDDLEDAPGGDADCVTAGLNAAPENFTEFNGEQMSTFRAGFEALSDADLSGFPEF